MTEADRRLTGKEWFKENKAMEIEDLTIEDTEVVMPKAEPEDDMAKFEEEKVDEDEEQD